jgi:type I restriction enzyme M protein
MPQASTAGETGFCYFTGAMLTSPLEFDVRHQVNKQLENLGWILDRQNPKQNVFFEQPRTEKERKKLKGKRPDYVLYKQGTSVPLIIIETKKPGVDILQALNQGIGYAEKLDTPIVYATDGVYCKTHHTKTHRPLILNGEEVDELIREVLAIRFLEDNEVNTISKQVIDSRHELIKIFDEANNMLRAEGLRAGIERFSEFANILFLKLISENEHIREEQGKQSSIKYEWRWDYFKDKREGELLDYINGVVLPNISRNYDDPDIFQELSIKSDATLKKIIDKLDPLTLTDINSDIKGDAFEYFLKASTVTGNDLGEYFTPRHVVKMMVKLVNPQLGEKVYDPFCGTGGLLIDSFRHIERNSVPTEENIDRLQKRTIYGNEITGTARITKMNMILAGDGHSNIKKINSLAFPSDNEFDVVVTNMPYSQETEYGRLYDLPTHDGDSICVQHCIRAINRAAPNGRLAIVVPEGFLFRKHLRNTREYLLRNTFLQSIISLPQGMFLPYSGVKTDILYCTKVKKSEPQSHYWFFDIQNDGFTLDNYRKKLEGDNDIDKFLTYRNIDSYENKDLIQVGFTIIDLQDVKENDYTLSKSNYIQLVDYGNVQWDLVELNDLCEKILGGGTPSTKVPQYWKGEIPWISSADIAGLHQITPRRYITVEAIQDSSTNQIPSGSVLVVTRVGLGKVALTDFSVCISQDIQGLVLKKDRVLPRYLLYVISDIVQQFKKVSRGSTIQGVTKQQLKKLKIPLPPLEIQQKIVDEIEGYQKKIEEAKQLVEMFDGKIQHRIKVIWGKGE